MKKKNANWVFSETKKKIIFIHSAMQITIDESITVNAVYIKPAKEEWKGSGINLLYYADEMRRAAGSDKKYLIMEYEPIIGEMIEALMKTPDQYNFCNWQFDTFFHADTCPPGEKPSPIYNTGDEKMNVLWGLYYYPFVFKYTVPAGYNLTERDLQEMDKVFPSRDISEDEFNEFLKNPPKPYLSFYDTDISKLKEYVEKQK